MSTNSNELLALRFFQTTHLVGVKAVAGVEEVADLVVVDLWQIDVSSIGGNHVTSYAVWLTQLSLQLIYQYY